MKKRNLILAILCLALGFALAACSDDDEEIKDTGPIQKEAGVDLKKTDKGPDKKVADLGPDGVTVPDLGPDGVTVPDLSEDGAPPDITPDVPVITDIPKPSCSLPFKSLPVSGGKGTVSGEVLKTEATSKVDLAATSCTSKVTKGAEHIYAAYLVANVKYYISLTPASGYDASLYVFTDCAKIAPTCLAGADAKSSGTAEAVNFTPPVTGIYFLGVDSKYAASTSSYSYGKYTLAVQEAKAPANDTCAGATTLSFPSGKMSITEAGTTLFATNKSSMTSSGCTKKTSDGPDMFYKINMVKDTLYKLKLDGSHNVSMYLFSDCANISTSCVKGADEWSYTEEEISFTPTATKDYYIAVDGRSSTDSGLFTLTVDKFDKPANDTCAKATKMTFSGTSATASGHTIGATNTVNMATTGCTKDDTEGPDVFYSVDLKAGKSYRVILTPASGYNAAVYVVSNCATATTSCVAGADANYSGTAEKVDISPKTTGTYYIGVDTHYAATSTYAAGKFTLDVLEIVPPVNNTCAKATKMTFSGTKATIKGDSAMATNTVNLPSTGCTSKDTEGPDMFYAVTLSAGKTYKITATPASGYDLAVYLLKGCGSPVSCVAGADSAYSGSADKASYSVTTTGTYYIGVDTSYAASSSYATGKFTVDIEEVQVPANNTCAKATALKLVGGKGSVKGDNTNATNTVKLTTAGCTGVAFQGGDLFYSVDLVAGKTYKFDVTASSNFNQGMILLTDCAKPATSCVAGADAEYSGTTEKMEVTAKTTGKYYVAVGTRYTTGDTYSYGTFTLSVSEITPPTAPVNNACAKLTALKWVAGVATVKGDTTNATNAILMPSTACTKKTVQGRDLFYSSILTAGKTYKLTVKPGTGFDVAAYVLNNCGKPVAS